MPLGDEFNFGLGRVIASDGNPRVEIQVIDTSGKSRYQVSFHASG